MSTIDFQARGNILITQRNLRRQTRTMGYSIVSRIHADMGGGQGTVTTGNTIATTSRIRHQNLTGKTVVAIAPVYAHYGPASSTEGATANQIIVKCGVEPLGTVSDQTTNVPIGPTFNGLYLVTLERRGVVFPDETPVYILANGYFYERTSITGPANGNLYNRNQFALGGTAGYGQDTGEGLDASDKQISGTVTNSAFASFSASLMLGKTADGTIARSAIGLGDSIMCGTDDAYYGANSGGWFHRAFAAYPGGALGIAGEKLSQAVLVTNFQTRFKLTAYATDIISNYGRNDIQASDTLVNFKANLLAFAYRFMARGQNFYQGTIPPAPTSTDGWFTATNQTKESGDALRLTYNAWLRDTTTAGFAAQATAAVAAIPYAGAAGILDICAGVECNISGVLTQNGGYVLGSQGALLTNGTATAGTTLSLTDSGKSWTVNQWKAKALYIVSGTGSGQMRTIAYNTATVLTLATAFSVALDATSVYQVYDALGMASTVHYTSTGYSLMAAAIASQVTAAMLGGGN